MAQQENQRDQKAKTGTVPNEEIKGSDADRAYDSDGNFVKATVDEKEVERDESQSGSDADTDSK
jgi:hypothetical protein